MISRLVSVLSVLPLAGALFAQSTPLLIGCTVDPALPSLQNTRQDIASCATKTCVTSLPAAGKPYAGGTAYDPTTGVVWHTDGTMLASNDPNSCNKACAAITLAPTIGNALATGLAFNEAINTLYMTDSNNTLWTWKGGCPPVANAKCSLSTVVPTTHIVAGLATSDAQRLIFYSASDFSAAAANNVIYIAQQATPCVPFCKFTPVACPGTVLQQITGLAYDDCKNLLWVTDGVIVVAMSIPATACQASFVACCRCLPTESYRGLCIQPSQASPLGSNCTKAPCATCPLMAHTTIGDATIGNSSFGLVLTSAPAGAPAVLVLNIGACSAPGINPFGLFCANLLVPVPGMITFSLGTGGTTGCTGGITFPLAVPHNPAYCGAVLSSQFLMVCPGAAGFGTAVSNCLSFMITAS